MLLLSRQGKVRLSKWYTTVNQKDRARIIRELTPMVLSRPLKLCNFLDWKDQKVALLAATLSGMGTCTVPVTAVCICMGRTGVCCSARCTQFAAGECLHVPHPHIHMAPQVVYKRYASLYFVCGIEPEDNELITLEVSRRTRC